MIQQWGEITAFAKALEKRAVGPYWPFWSAVRRLSLHLQVFGSAALPHGCVSEGVALLSFRAQGVSEAEADNVWSHDSEAGLLSTYIQEHFLFLQVITALEECHR